MECRVFDATLPPKRNTKVLDNCRLVVLDCAFQQNLQVIVHNQVAPSWRSRKTVDTKHMTLVPGTKNNDTYWHLNYYYLL
jgi:hypothetical protein